MRTISIIFKRELASYLRSPIGYIIAAVLLFVCGVLFQWQGLGQKSLDSAAVLSKFFEFSSGTTIIAAVILSVYAVAFEWQQNTHVLLNTSPVRDVEIVVGKYLAALVLLCGIVALSFYMPLLVLLRGKITVSQVIVGYAGLFLLGSASLAIGMFASSIARHPLIVAVIGAGLAGVMWLLYPLAANLDPPLQGVLQDVGLWHKHYALTFMQGKLHLKDIIYYIAVTYFFLMLATKTLEAKRWR